MRIMSVIGAAALALMCLALPAAAAPPNDHLAFDVMAYELAVVPALDDAAMLTVNQPDQPALLVLAGTITADKADGYCDGVGNADLTRCLDLRFGVTSRHYDPGWRTG